MAKDDKTKDVEEDEEKSSSGSSNKVVYGLIIFLFILVIIAMIMAGLGLSNVPESWSWKGNISVIVATVPEVAVNASGDSLKPVVTFSNDDLNRTYNVLSVNAKLAYTGDGEVSPSLDISGFKGSSANKVLRVLNNGLKYTPTSSGTTKYAPLIVKGFVQPSNSDIATITLQNGEYAEFLQQANTNPTFMGISYNAPVSTTVTTTVTTTGNSTTGTGTGTGTLTQKG